MAETPLRVRIKRVRRRWLFVGLRTVLRAGGIDGARALGRWLGGWRYRLLRGARRRLQADIGAALGRTADDPAVAALLREAYRVNDAAVLEIMSVFDRRLADTAIAARCEIDGGEQLRAAMADGRGAILLAAHMGNAALLALKLAADGWPVSVVYREARMMSAGFFQDGLERYGIQGILANAGLMAYGQMLKALKGGRIVFMMLDQGVKKAEDGSMQRFLGKTVPMPAGPAQLARAARAPLLPVATVASEPRWHFVIGPAVPLGHGPLEADVARLVAITERQVLDHPELWSWHQRRWRRYPRSAA